MGKNRYNIYIIYYNINFEKSNHFLVKKLIYKNTESKGLTLHSCIYINFFIW